MHVNLDGGMSDLKKKTSPVGFIFLHDHSSDLSGRKRYQYKYHVNVIKRVAALVAISSL